MIELRQTAAYHGPNPLAGEPVIVARLGLSPGIADSADSLAAEMSGVFAEWWPGRQRPSGESPELFIARYLADWSLAALNEVAGFLHVAGARQVGDQVEAWLGFHDSTLSFNSLRLGARLLSAIGNHEVPAEGLHQAMTEFWRRCRKSHPDYQAGILMAAARGRDIPYRRFAPNLRRWQFGWGRNSLVFFESKSEEDSSLGSKLGGSKATSKDYFRMMGAPTVDHLMVKDASQLEDASARIGWPCVVKPLDMAQARGVTVNIRDMGELSQAFAKARRLTDEPVMVESHVEGDVYRFLVIRGKFFAATRRDPACVVGNGKDSLLELAEQFNSERTENARPGSYLGPVPLDGELDKAIAKQGYHRESVPEAGKKVRLREIPLQGTGASNTDVTREVHPDTRVIAESLAKTIGIQIAGFDFISTDISRSCQETGAFLEINGTPSLRGHLEDGVDARGVGDAVLGSHPSRIPAFLVLAEPGQLSDYSGLRLDRPGLGWYGDNKAGLGRTLLAMGGTDMMEATDMLLKNKCVEAVLVTCTPAEVEANGLPFDRTDYCFFDPDTVGPGWQEVIRRHSLAHGPLPKPARFPETMREMLGSGE